MINPVFDGTVQHKIEDESVIEFAFITDEITDLWPVRSLAELKILGCHGSAPKKGKLSNLAPLKGLQLRHLGGSNTRVADLTPLVEMKLTSLYYLTTQVFDLTPLKGMPLKNLNCTDTPVTDKDLATLASIPTMTKLDLTYTTVTDEGVKALRKALPKCKITHESIPGSVDPNTDANKKTPE